MYFFLTGNTFKTLILSKMFWITIKWGMIESEYIPVLNAIVSRKFL